MTKRQRIIECPCCEKQICITLETLDDITFVDVEKGESESETSGAEKPVRNIDWELAIAVLGLVGLLLLVLFGVV